MPCSSLIVYVTKLDDENPSTSTVVCDLEEIDHSSKSRPAGEMRCYVPQGNLPHRFDHDLARREGVSASNPHSRLLPDTHSAGNFAAANSVAQGLYELHRELWSAGSLTSAKVTAMVYQSCR